MGGVYKYIKLSVGEATNVRSIFANLCAIYPLWEAIKRKAHLAYVINSDRMNFWHEYCLPLS